VRGYDFGQPYDLPSPAAGSGVVWPIASALPVRIEAVTFKMVTSGTAGNRRPVIEYLDSEGFPFAFAGAPYVQAASLTSLYCFFVGGTQVGADGAPHIGGPLPNIATDLRTTLAIDVETIKPADQISNVRLWVVPLTEYDLPPRQRATSAQEA